MVVPSLSSEREVFNAGKKQELLSASAAYALEAEDIQMLRALKKAGWDASKQLGQMPDQDLHLKLTPLTFSTLLGAEESVRWLLETCGLSRDSRDGNLDRPIDVLVLIQTPGYGFAPDKKKIEGLQQLLHRETQPEEAGAMEELTGSVISKFGKAQHSIKSVNDAPPSDTWKQLEKALEQTSDLEDREQENKREGVILRVKWDQIAKDEYRFSVVSGGEEWGGGGVSGVIYHKFGYWMTKDVKYWDS